MLERFAKLISRPKRGKGKSRKPKRRAAKRAGVFLTTLAERPMLLLACGAGIGLVVGALLATHRPAPVEATTPKPIVKQQLAAVAPQPREVESEPTAPPPAPPATTLPAPSVPMAPPTSNAGGHTAWQQYAKAVPETGGRPMIAIVIDDMGIDKAEAA